MLFGNLQIIKRDGSDGSHFPITSETIFGSNASADVRLKVTGVADRQCRIVPCISTKKMQLEVLDDTCGGTLVNGIKIAVGETLQLCDGDVLTVTDRQFKLLYPVSSVKRPSTKTPGSIMKAKRRSIFNRTPPSPATLGHKQNRQDEETQAVPEVINTPSIEASNNLHTSSSPKPRKSILSAKKNLLVARTPTMSPKVVTWGNNRYKSPESCRSPKKSAKVSRYTISGFEACESRKQQNVGPLGTKIKVGQPSSTNTNGETPAGVSIRRRSAHVVSCSTPNPNVMKDPPVKARDTSFIATLITGSIPMTAKKLPVGISEDCTAKSPAILNQKSLGEAAVDAIPRPAISSTSCTDTITEQNSVSNEDIAPGIARRTRRSSFLAEQQTTISSPHACGNLSMVTQPSDSFGSLSVSDVDISLFDGSMTNDNTINNTIVRNRKGSTTSMNSPASRRATRGSNTSPKMLEKSPVNTANFVMSEFLMPSSTNESLKPFHPNDMEKCLENSPSMENIFAAPENEIKPNQTEVPSNVLEIKQEIVAPIQKTWAGVLKSSIASGSPFKITKRSVKSAAVGRLKPLENRSFLKDDTTSKLNAATASTGHALSPQTIIVNKKFAKFGTAKAFVTPLSKSRKSSIVTLTPDIETDMFVSPLNTPDNSEAISRASAFIANSHIAEDLGPHDLNTSDLNESVRTPMRRTSRNSTATEEGVLQSREANDEMGTPCVRVADNSPGTLKKNTLLASRHNESPVNSLEDVRGVKRLMTIASPVNVLDNFDGVKELLRTPKQKVGNSLADVDGVRKLLTTPKETRSPRNSLSNVIGVKKMLATPHDLQTPENNLDRTFSGVKAMVATPVEARSPKNNLDITFRGVKKLLNTPSQSQSPKNDLDITFRGVKKLVGSPIKATSPRNDLDISFRGVKKLLTTTITVKSPENDLDITFGGLKKLVNTPSEMVSPKNTLDCSFRGLKRLLTTPKENVITPDSSVLEGVADLMVTPVNTSRKRISVSPVTIAAKRGRRQEVASVSANVRNRKKNISTVEAIGSVEAIVISENAHSECRNQTGLHEFDADDVDARESARQQKPNLRSMRPRRGRDTIPEQIAHSTTEIPKENIAYNDLNCRTDANDTAGKERSNILNLKEMEQFISENQSAAKRTRGRRAKAGEIQDVASESNFQNGRHEKREPIKKTRAAIEDQDGDELNVSKNFTPEKVEKGSKARNPQRAARGKREEEGLELSDEGEGVRKAIRGRKKVHASKVPTRGRRGHQEDIEADIKAEEEFVSDEIEAKSELIRVNRPRANKAEVELKQSSSRHRKVNYPDSSETADQQIRERRARRVNDGVPKKKELERNESEAESQGRTGQRARRGVLQSKGEQNLVGVQSSIDQKNSKNVSANRRGRKAVDLMLQIESDDEHEPKKSRIQTKVTSMDDKSKVVNIDESEDLIQKQVTTKAIRGKKADNVLAPTDETTKAEEPKKRRGREAKTKTLELRKDEGSEKSGTKRPLGESMSNEGTSKRPALNVVVDNKETSRTTRSRRR